MSERARRTKVVFDTAKALHEAGAAVFRPGDVVDRLRGTEMPFDAWQVRGELSNLERLGLAVLETDTATWQLVGGRTFCIEAAKALHS